MELLLLLIILLLLLPLLWKYGITTTTTATIIIIIIISAVVAEVRSWKPPPLEFVVEHPFLFIIWEKRLNTTLFMGRFSGSE
jgi:serine protease inhibitor